MIATGEQGVFTLSFVNRIHNAFFEAGGNFFKKDDGVEDLLSQSIREGPP